jgi:hypothetical protein
VDQRQPTVDRKFRPDAVRPRFRTDLEMCALEAAVRKKAPETSDARKEEQPSRPELRTDKVSRYEGSALWNIYLLLYIHNHFILEKLSVHISESGNVSGLASMTPNGPTTGTSPTAYRANATLFTPTTILISPIL